MQTREVKLGDIYYIPLTKDDDVTPKGGFSSRKKYCFIVGFSEYGFYVAYFLMNSHINVRHLNTPQLLSCQYPLRHKDYPEIIVAEKDPSYLDLGHVRELERSRLISDGVFKGTLIQSDFENIFTWLKHSDQYSPKQKHRYGWI